MTFGTVWRESPATFWDGMWAKHFDSPMTTRMLDLAAASNVVCEVGAGCGHFLEALLQRGWKGRFHGFEMSRKGAEAIRQLCRHHGIEATVLAGDFLEHAARESLPRAEVALCRGVVQHQAHWMPMALAMLRIAPLAVLGVGYVSGTGYHESILHRDAGHYDVQIAPDLLQREAEAVGLHVDLEHFRNRRRRCRELLVLLSAGEAAE